MTTPTPNPTNSTTPNILHLLAIVYQNTWAVEESVFASMLEIIERKAVGEKVSAEDIAAVVKARDERRAERQAAEDVPEGITENTAYSVGSVRVVPVSGVIAPRASMVNGISQPMGTNAGRIESDLFAAAEDPRCSGVLMLMDSPGGAVAGTEMVVDAIRHVRTKKPVHAYSPGMCASGAYWIASAAERITAARSALLGSIGVFAVRDDTSKILENRGVKRHVIRSGKHKGSGIEGTPITDADKAKWQSEVNALHAIFAGDVAAGRGLTAEQTAAVADGSVFTGQDAVGLHLADAVGTFTQAIAAVEAAAANIPATGPGRLGTGRTNPPGVRIAMTPAELREKHGEAVALIEAAAVEKFRAQNPPTPTTPTAKPPEPAAFAALSAAFGAKDGGREFIFEAQQKGMTMDAARDAWAAKIESENARLRKEAETKTAAQANGTPPVPNFTPAAPVAPSASTGPSEYGAAVKMIEQRDRVKRPVAMRKAQSEFPKLHAAWRDADFPAIV